MQALALQGFKTEIGRNIDQPHASMLAYKVDFLSKSYAIDIFISDWNEDFRPMASEWPDENCI